jgi:hypothetical protein
MMTPPSKCFILTSTTKMDPQRLLTLPGYSWRRKRHEGDKRGWATTLFLFLRSFFPLSETGKSPTAKKVSLQLKMLRNSIRN